MDEHILTIMSVKLIRWCNPIRFTGYSRLTTEPGTQQTVHSRGRLWLGEIKR